MVDIPYLCISLYHMALIYERHVIRCNTKRGYQINFNFKKMHFDIIYVWASMVQVRRVKKKYFYVMNVMF